MYLLDTNVVSALRARAGAYAEPKAIAWADRMDPATLFLSVVTIYELEIGVLAKERRDPVQGAVLRSWLDGRVHTAFMGRILDFTSAAAERAAALHIPNPKSERDSFIAGTALVHGMAVVTRNLADFRSMGLQLINPWDA